VINISGGEDLRKNFEEIFTRLDSLKDADSQIGSLRKIVSDLEDSVKAFAKRHRSQPGTSELDLLSRREVAELGMKAIHQAPTPVKYSGRFPGGIAPGEGPVSRFQEASDGLCLLGALLGQPGVNPEPAMRATRYYTDVYVPARTEAQEFVKAAAMDSATGEGGDWIPTEMSARLIELIRLEGGVANLFEMIPMPRSPYEFPTFLSKITGFKMTEQTTDAPTKISVGQPGTVSSKFTLTAVGIGSRMLTSRFLEEDSIVPILGLLERQLAIALTEAREDAIINGDTAGTHQDNDTDGGAADLAAKSWDGLRKAGLAKTAKLALGGKIDSDAQWRAGIAKIRGLMGKYGVNSSKVGLILGPQVASGQVPYIEAFRTLEVFGALATNITGQFGVRGPDGFTRVVSEYMREDLASTGVNTVGGPNTLAACLLVNKMAWFVGQVRNITLQRLVELYAESDQDAIVATARWAFGTPYAAADNHTAYLYNITL
jgi:hypothetical protein